MPCSIVYQLLIFVFFLTLSDWTPAGTTPTTCTGVWTTVACGTSNEEESECDIASLSTILSVTVAQLASNASCQYHEIQPDEDPPSERYGKEEAGIWVTGTCIGIFNVCLGENGSCCDPMPTVTAATFSDLSTAKKSTLSQNQHKYVNSCDMDAAIITGSTVGGCLFLSAFLMGTYLLCRQDSCCRARVFPKCGSGNEENDNGRGSRSGVEADDGLV